MKSASENKAAGAGVLGAGALFVLVIGPLLFFVCLTMFRLAGAPEVSTGPTAIGEASAVVRACDRKGPISSEGLGYFWECDANVTVNGHPVGVLRFDPDELTPADGANPVGVRPSGDHWQRDVAHPYRLLHAAGLVVLVVDFFGMLVALIPVLALILWLFTRLRRREEHEEATQQNERRVVIRFRAPAKPKRRSPAGATVLGLGGMFLLVVGAWMLYIHGRLSGDIWGGAAAASIIVLGLVFLIATAWWAFAPEKAGDTRMIELTEAGINQQDDKAEELLLPWEDLRSVVFDERGQSDKISAHLVLLDETAKGKLLKEYRRPSKHGVLLTPDIEPNQAELAATTIEGFHPGLVRWRSRELARRGFGPDVNLDSGLVRWKDAATTRGTAVATGNADEPVRIRSSRMPGARILGFVGLYALIVLLFVLRQLGDVIPVWLSPVVALATLAWGVMLYNTRFRGSPGVFELDDDSLTWFERDNPPRRVVPTDIPPVDVPLASLQQIQFERLKAEHGRRYVKVSVRRDGIQSVLAKRITTAAASRLAATLTSRTVTDEIGFGCRRTGSLE